MPASPRDPARELARLRCLRPTVHCGADVRGTLDEIVGALEPSALWPIVSTVFEQAIACGQAEHVTAYFDALVERAPYAEIVERITDAGDRHVLFFARRPYFSIVREAMHLRQRGWRCSLLYLEPHAPGLETCLSDAFEAVWRIPNSLLLAEAIVRALVSGVVHVQTWQYDYATTVALIRAAQRVPVVAEFVDIASLIGDPALLEQAFPGNDAAFDLAMEREVCTTAAAVVTRFPPAAWPLLEAAHGPLTRFVRFWPYPSPRYFVDAEPSSKTGELRAVYAGGLSDAPGPNTPKNTFGGHTLPAVFRDLLTQGIAVDVLHDPYRPVANYHNPEVDALRREFPHFRFLDGVGPEQLAPRLADYDIGLVAFKVPPGGYRTCPELIRYGIGTKLFPFFEAGVPVLVTSEFETVASLVSKHELGLAVPSAELPTVRGRLTPEALRCWRAGVRRYRDSHGMHRMIDVLADLYADLVMRRDAAEQRRHG